VADLVSRGKFLWGKGDVRAEIALHFPQRIFHETFFAAEESGRVIQEVVTPR